MSVDLADRPQTTLNLDIGSDKGYPQAEFVYEDGAFNVGYFGGVGIGKTSAIVLDAFPFAAEFPGSRQIITEPTFQMVRDILLPTIRDHFAQWVGTAFTLPLSPPIDVRFPANGSEIWLRSTEVGERLLGPTVARVLMDEVTLGHQEEQHGWLASRCRQPGYRLQLKVTGTPKGRNWVYDRFVGDKKLRDLRVLTAQTADNTHLPKGYVERLLDTYGGWDAPLARQELLGQWIQMAGQVFAQFARDTHIRSLVPGEAQLLKNRLGGIDFGGVSPTALVAGGLDATGRARAYKEWYHHEATMDQTITGMAEMQEAAGITTWVADPSGKQEIETLRRAGFNVRPARHGNKLALRVQLVGARLNVGPTKLPGMYVAPECPNLITELETLAWKRVKLQGRVEEHMADEFERGAPDHAFDAWANILAEYDSVPAPYVRPEPVTVYGEIG